VTAKLDVETLDLSFDEQLVLRQVSFSLAAGQIGCVLGPSGCGKTTLMRAIAGFEPLNSGRILLDNMEVSSAQYCLPPERRNIGMVFQDFALFPHLNVADNISFGLNKWSSQDQLSRVQELLAMVGLPAYGKAYPDQLSGGQQQRIALARALAPRPGLLLMDEPFSSMDVELRDQLAREVRNILKQENMTAVLVTHDQNEAFALADDICVMNEGRIEQQDSGYNLYHRPANRFVADFIGLGVFIPARVEGPDQVSTDLGIIHGTTDLDLLPGSVIDILIRPDDVIHDDASSQTAIVIEKAFRGADFLYHLRLDSGIEVLCFAPSHHNHRINERIGIRLDVDHLVTFDQS
jgi:iron(III) transport system ATP-binding protein